MGPMTQSRTLRLNQVLEAWCGAGLVVRIGSYTASLSCLVLSLERDGICVASLKVFGCQRLSGPMRWENPRLEFELTDDLTGQRFRLLDRGASFEAVGSFAVAADPETGVWEDDPHDAELVP